MKNVAIVLLLSFCFILTGCNNAEDKIDDVSNSNSIDNEILSNLVENATNDQESINLIKDALKDADWLKTNIRYKKNDILAGGEETILEDYYGLDEQDINFSQSEDRKYVIVSVEDSEGKQILLVFCENGNVKSVALVHFSTATYSAVCIDTKEKVLYINEIQTALHSNTETYYRISENGLIELKSFAKYGVITGGNMLYMDDKSISESLYEQNRKDMYNSYDFQEIDIELTNENVDMYINYLDDTSN